MSTGPDKDADGTAFVVEIVEDPALPDTEKPAAAETEKEPDPGDELEAADADEKPDDSEAVKRERRRKRAAQRENNKLKRELDEVKGVVQQLVQRQGSAEQNQAATVEQQLETAWKQTEAARVEALKVGDIDAFRAADEQFREVDKRRDHFRAWKQNQASQAQQPRQAPAPEWVDDWKADNPWYGRDAEASERAARISERLAKTVPAHTEEHRTLLDVEIRKTMPHLFKERVKPPQVVAPGTRAPTTGGKVQVPQALVDAYRSMGKDVSDPKIQQRMARYYQESKSSRGS